MIFLSFIRSIIININIKLKDTEQNKQLNFVCCDSRYLPFTTVIQEVKFYMKLQIYRKPDTFIVEYLFSTQQKFGLGYY